MSSSSLFCRDSRRSFCRFVSFLLGVPILHTSVGRRLVSERERVRPCQRHFGRFRLYREGRRLSCLVFGCGSLFNLAARVVQCVG